jgi:hypothetical protein
LVSFAVSKELFLSRSRFAKISHKICAEAFEEFQIKFAQPLWRDEAEHFLGYPGPTSPNRQARAGAPNKQTTNKQVRFN